MEEAELRAERGAFFGSIFATANHLLWADTIWMSRFDGWDAPKGGIPRSPEFTPDLPAYLAARHAADGRIVGWADRLDDGALRGDLAWYSGGLGRDMMQPLALCVAHFFNHQTHHRGQIHAMLTAAGQHPGDTDLFVLPKDA